jgi:hypothetical protein
MSRHSLQAAGRNPGDRRAVALVAVLYFLVVCGLTIIGLLFTNRVATRNTHATGVGAQLLYEAESAAYAALAHWDGLARDRQPVGTTTHLSQLDGAIVTDVYITRVTSRLFSIVADASGPAAVARRTELLVRAPFALPRVASALVSAVNVTIGPGVRFLSDGACDDSSTAITLAPGASLTVDSTVERPSTRTDAIASDSATYLRPGDAWWTDLTGAADILLARDVAVTSTPAVVAGTCESRADNWGDPTSTTSPCATRAPVIYAPGDLTIEGGVGQGVLLVDGHLVIAGPFTFSGQIVARHGIETRADNIAISGVVYAWRASADSTASRATTNEIMLTHSTTLRASRCDAGHGMASWLQPRRVRQRASAELF